MYEDAGDYGFIYGDEGNPLQPLIGFYQLAGGDSLPPCPTGSNQGSQLHRRSTSQPSCTLYRSVRGAH